ncbi:hypothetical protein CCACVL1_10035 [Corchorus capsularis]|uniref:Uncharacterized protein n=1 Tax=Corchorus capsularis TaxID=210143 RepID=A0A1R3ISX9_COCAP|nr:hypothetical protein CCACVL1_10035 [Corchorus capsularis]
MEITRFEFERMDKIKILVKGANQ